jgi:hypothetical protein
MPDRAVLPLLDAKPQPSIESMHNSNILMHFLLMILSIAWTVRHQTFECGKGYLIILSIPRSVNVAASSEEYIALNDRETEEWWIRKDLEVNVTWGNILVYILRDWVKPQTPPPRCGRCHDQSSNQVSISWIHPTALPLSYLFGT